MSMESATLTILLLILFDTICIVTITLYTAIYIRRVLRHVTSLDAHLLRRKLPVTLVKKERGTP